MESWVFGEKIPETEPQNILDIAQMPRPGPSNRCKLIWLLPLSNTFLCHLYLSVTCEMFAIEGPIPMHCNDKVNLIGRLNTTSDISFWTVCIQGCPWTVFLTLVVFLTLSLTYICSSTYTYPLCCQRLNFVLLCSALFCSALHFPACHIHL